jgi:hypothetical protein
LPSGKFGKSASVKAVFWNFYPGQWLLGQKILTEWKNNSYFAARRWRGPCHDRKNFCNLTNHFRNRPNLSSAPSVKWARLKALEYVKLGLNESGIFC